MIVIRYVDDPSVEDIETNDDVELAEVKMVLAEMNRTKSEMDALLEVHASSSRLEHIAVVNRGETER